ncbi:MAG: hypothetical protein ACP5G6_03470 [Conexivisphaera sp.]
MDIESWLREFLSSRMDADRVERVISRIPAHILRGDSSALYIDGGDYESLEGLRSLLQEGDSGASAISDMLSWMESSGGPRSMTAQWYRSVMRLERREGRGEPSN